MKLNLDTLRAEIEQHLDGEGFSIFHGHSRMLDSHSLVFWDTEHYPDYQLFVKTAKTAGARIMVFHQREFDADIIDDAVEQLQVTDLPVDEQRTIERRLKDMRAYEGFTCSLELSFDYESRIYLFDLQTDWYREFTSMLEDLNLFEPEDDSEDGEDAIGGYFSKN